MKKISFFAVLASLVFATVPVLAQPSVPVNLPESASNSHVISLGTAVDPQSGKVVEGYAIVHPIPANARGGKGGHSGGGGSVCYAFMAKGAKWKSVEDYMVDTTNPYGLTDSFIRSNVAANIAKWEDAADGTLDSNSINIIGNEVSGTVDGADTVAPDGKNEVMFGTLDPGTIGVTIVWGIFSGPTFARELVEWDQVFNTYYPWSESGEAGKMDFNNISTHELGHTFGLGDLYDSGCADQTMYGYADYGQTNKQTLEAGDILGISTLY